MTSLNTIPPLLTTMMITSKSSCNRSTLLCMMSLLLWAGERSTALAAPSSSLPTSRPLLSKPASSSFVTTFDSSLMCFLKSTSSSSSSSSSSSPVNSHYSSPLAVMPSLANDIPHLPLIMTRRHTSSSTSLFLKRLKSKRSRRNAAGSRIETSRIIQHHEAAGITSGIGLWTVMRRRWKRRKRRLQARKRWLAFSRTWNRNRHFYDNYYYFDDSRHSGKNYLTNNIHSASNMNTHRSYLDVQDDNDQNDDDYYYFEEYNEFSLDAMIAKAGVLRTGIRLRQEELIDLERLMSDLNDDIQTSNTNNNITKTNVVFKSNQDDDDNDLDNDDDDQLNTLMNEFQLDLMKTRSAELQSSILVDQLKLQRLDRRIICYESSDLGLVENAIFSALSLLNDFEFSTEGNTSSSSSLSSSIASSSTLYNLLHPITTMQRQAIKFTNTFSESTSVLLRKLDRVSTQTGPNNQHFERSIPNFLAHETAAGMRILGNLLSNPRQILHLVDPDTPTLVPHVPAILARLDRLESHVSPILSRVLNNKQHLRTIEPYLPEILERFDDIEPHLPWILDNIDALAPYTGLLLKHIDELLLYAEVDEHESNQHNNDGDDDYAFAEQLLPYLELYVSQLDLVGPHLPLLRPHLPLLLKHNRIKILSPHVGVLFSKGYKDLSASANMDILLFWFGWALRIPFIPRLFFSLPGSPGMVSFLAKRLPKRLVRGRCSDVTCHVDGDYGGGWNKLSKLYEMENVK